MTSAYAPGELHGVIQKVLDESLMLHPDSPHCPRWFSQSTREIWAGRGSGSTLNEWCTLTPMRPHSASRPPTPPPLCCPPSLGSRWRWSTGTMQSELTWILVWQLNDKPLISGALSWFPPSLWSFRECWEQPWKVRDIISEFLELNKLLTIIKLGWKPLHFEKSFVPFHYR